MKGMLQISNSTWLSDQSSFDLHNGETTVCLFHTDYTIVPYDMLKENSIAVCFYSQSYSQNVYIQPVSDCCSDCWTGGGIHLYRATGKHNSVT